MKKKGSRYVANAGKQSGVSSLSIAAGSNGLIRGTIIMNARRKQKGGLSSRSSSRAQKGGRYHPKEDAYTVMPPLDARGNDSSDEEASDEESNDGRKQKGGLSSKSSSRAQKGGRYHPKEDACADMPPLNAEGDDSSDEESSDEDSDDNTPARYGRKRDIKQKGRLSSRSRMRAQKKGGRYHPKEKADKPPRAIRCDDASDDDAVAGTTSPYRGTQEQVVPSLIAKSKTKDECLVTDEPKVVTKSDSKTIFRHDVSFIENNNLSFGLSKVGFGEQRQHCVCRGVNIARFKAFYGVPPVTVRALLKDLKEAYSSAEFVYLLLALNWLKLYSTEPVLSGRWGYCNDHIRKMTKVYVKMIQSLKEKKITFDGFDPEEIHLISVDTVNFRTQEFRLDPSTDWFDVKSHSSGLKYEFACALRSPKVSKVVHCRLQFSI